MKAGLSDDRKSELARELSEGKFREKNSFSNPKYETINKLGNLSSLTKKANGQSSNTGASWRGSNDSARQMPDVYSPLWLQSNLNLPRDRATINAWSRSFFSLNPIVNNSISLHSTYPISKLNIKCKDPKVESFFNAMIEDTNLMNICVQIAQEYWTLGEAFVYAELDEKNACWSKFLIQNPDYVSVHNSSISNEPKISLRPDQNLKRLVFSTNPADAEMRAQLDPSIIEYVRRGQNIPLNNLYISHLARKAFPYEERGTGLIVPIFRQLMLFDQLRESKFAQASNQINPLTLIKIGSSEFRPTPEDLEMWRNTFEQVQYDKDAKVFTHNDVAVDIVNRGSGMYDISNDITQLIKEIYIGLMVPSVVMDGSDTTYSSGSVSLDVLRQRYMQFRNMLSSWLKRKIFAPISKLNEFYEYEGGTKKLIVPDVDWNHMSLFDMSDYINNISSLATGEGPAKKVSVQSLFRSLGLDYDDEQRKIKYEDIQDSIRAKEMAALQNYTLNDLRALSPDDEIEEPVANPVPGEDPYEDGTPGVEDESGGMDFDMGGLDMGGDLGGDLGGMDFDMGSDSGGYEPSAPSAPGISGGEPVPE